MKTRSEALTEALEKVDSSITDINEKISEAVKIMEYERSEHALAIKENHLRHSESMKEAVETSFHGLIIFGVLTLIAPIINERRQENLRALNETIRTIEIYSSFISLQDKYGAMKYRFVLKRIYASNSTKDERAQTINLLIMMNVIQDNYQNDPDLLYIDENSAPVKAFKKRVRKLFELAKK